METVKRKRSAQRAVFTKATKELQVELEKTEPRDAEVIEISWKRVEQRNQDLEKLNERIAIAMEEAPNTTEEAFDEESTAIWDYRDKFSLLQRQVDKIRIQLDRLDDTGSVGTDQTKKYRLPKLELLKFSGEPKEWLGWWSQFSSIHEDEGMASKEKFQYLIQATVENSKARDVVNSFPPTTENYPKVIGYLRKRFGRRPLLRQIYIREMISLVVSNAVNQIKSVSAIYDELETQLRALESLGVTSEKYACFLYPMVESSLPEKVLEKWQSQKPVDNEEDDEEEDLLTPLVSFLRREVEGETNIKLAQTGFSKTNTQGNKQNQKYGKRSLERVPTATELLSGDRWEKPGCIFCDKPHPSGECFRAMNMNLEEKNKIIRKKKGCFTCLKVGHHSKVCKSKLKCIICEKGHVSIMCPSKYKTSPSMEEKSDENQPEKSVSMANYSSSQVPLQTLMVRMRFGEEERLVRAIIDPGSQNSYVTRKAVTVLNMKSTGEIKLAHSLFGGHETNARSHKSYQIEVSSLDRKFSGVFCVLETPTICGSVARVPEGAWLTELRRAGITVTDIGHGVPPDINLLIGNDYFWTIATGRKYPTKEGPIAGETKLGWVLGGRCVTNKPLKDHSLLAVTLHVQEANIQNLWKLDVLGIEDCAAVKSRQELLESALNHFQRTVSRGADGRYEVALPWIEDHPPVSENKESSKKRLLAVTNKLDIQDRKEDYQNIFDRWEEEGVIEKVPEGELGNYRSYLPHRPVFNPKSLTTPIRPVFDASAKERGKPSLNSCLEKGPNLIELVPAVLIRFRQKKYGLVSDIKKAFLQIGVKVEDRDWLRFLWWKKESEELLEYRHRRVVFGVSSSPFLLAATLNHHLDHGPREYQDTAQLLKKSLYVDNCLISMDSEEEVRNFVRRSTDLLAEAHFNLRGWVWSEVISSKTEDCNHVTSVLGLLWKVQTDVLELDLRNFTKAEDGPVTKRKILSAAHKLFDPIGFSCPVTLVPKLLLQELWSTKIGWDEAVPEEVSKKFNKWLKQIPHLGGAKIPRWIFTREYSQADRSLHVFVDASKCAYAGCIFMRGEDDTGISVQLVMAKTRVAPTKKLSIPRLELLSCCIGARLTVFVKETLQLTNIKTYYWTDSSNALYWIQNDENWATFVGNRVQEIRRLTEAKDWRHVPGERNPADLPSRGCTAEVLVTSRWWEKPEWLWRPAINWPVSNVNVEMEIVMTERKRTVVSNLVGDKEKSMLGYFSSFRKNVRLVAWMFRWRNRIKKEAVRPAGELTQEEENMGELHLLKLIQSESLPVKDSMISHLNVVRDSVGVWRVKTRILRREDEKDFKYPIVLPSDHDLVSQLVKCEHLKRNHCGVQVLMTALREKLWIIKSRKTIRGVLNSCVKCKRFSAKNLTSPSAPLPLTRVRDSAVFEVIGIDLGGPLILRNEQKSWFVVFTCAVYRAVHLELLTSLSTEAFLQSLRRFIARRGRPSIIYSDNATNFEGSDNATSKLDWKKIEASTSTQQIKWKFIPPGAPWWGGWWERIVGMTKVLLRKILGKASLNYEELMTIICDCESVINSRPLTYISEDPEDLEPLTPAMFLSDNRSFGVPDLDQLDATGFNRRFQYRQKLRDDLRKRFRSEYLAYLVQRQKSAKKSPSIHVGDLVMVGCDNLKRVNWPLARVIEVCPGLDGVTRVVKLKTMRGVLTRAIQRVYPLETLIEAKTSTKVISRTPHVTEPERSCNITEDKIVLTRSGRRVRFPQRFGAD